MTTTVVNCSGTVITGDPDESVMVNVTGVESVVQVDVDRGVVVVGVTSSGPPVPSELEEELEDELDSGVDEEVSRVDDEEDGGGVDELDVDGTVSGPPVPSGEEFEGVDIELSTEEELDGGGVNTGVETEGVDMYEDEALELYEDDGSSVTIKLDDDDSDIIVDVWGTYVDEGGGVYDVGGKYVDGGAGGVEEGTQSGWPYDGIEEAGGK
ncbi:hypothetical protein FRC15_006189, partial [Serendipita sp. 397]